MSKHSDHPRANPSGSRPKLQPASESDLELMRWLDGELDEAPAAVGPSATKVRDLELVGMLLRDRAASDTRADGIADAVMAAIAAEKTAPRVEVAADVVPLPTAPRLERVAAKRPANDNARSIFALAAFAAAAAAALFFWGRTGNQADAPTDEVAAVAELTGAAPVGALPEAAVMAPVAVEPRVVDTAPAVKVASVDFGARSGSVFYMSSGNDDAVDDDVAVVWVNDESAGGRP